MRVECESVPNFIDEVLLALISNSKEYPMYTTIQAPLSRKTMFTVCYVESDESIHLTAANIWPIPFKRDRLCDIIYKNNYDPPVMFYERVVHRLMSFFGLDKYEVKYRSIQKILGGKRWNGVYTLGADE